MGQSVGTQQQPIADEDIGRNKIALQDRFKPGRQGQDMAVRMTGCLLGREAAFAHITVHEGVVASQLPDVSRSEEIAPTVVAIQHKEREAGRDIRRAITSVVPIPSKDG